MIITEQVERLGKSLFGGNASNLTMNNTIQTVFFGIITIILALLVITVYNQELKIAKLEQENVVIELQKELSVEEIAKLSSAEESKTNKLAQQSFLDTNKSIIGEIKSIVGNSITVEAVVTNITGLEQVDFSKSSTIGLIKKTYQITVAPTTIFKKEKLGQLKVGDMLQVSSDSSILLVNKFTAKEISLFSPGN